MDTQTVLTPVEQPKTEVEAKPPPPPLQTELDPKPAVKAPESATDRAKAAWEKVRTDRAKQLAAQAKSPEAKPADPPAAETKPAEPPVEVKPTPRGQAVTKPPESPLEPASTALAKAARLERQAREQLHKAKETEANAEKRIADIEAKLAEQEKRRTDARLNPIAWLQEGGFSYEDAAQFQINGAKPTPELQSMRALEEIDRLKREVAKSREDSVKAEQQRAQQAQQQEYQTWRRGIVDFVNANASKYELVAQQGAQEQVANVIEQQFRQTQKVLSETEAAELVEKYLEEQIEKSVKSVVKLQTKLGLSGTKPPPEVVVAAPTGEPALTNRLTASTHATNGAPKSRDWESVKERALLAMRNAQKRP